MEDSALLLIWKVVRNPWRLDSYKAIVSYLFETPLTVLLLASNIALYFLIGPKPDLLFHPHNIFSTWYTIITSLFTHWDQIHLWNNMIGLYIFGRLVEKRVGAVKMGFLFFGSGLTANAAYAAIYWSSNTATLGVSGAVMGLVSAGIMLMPWHYSYELITPLPIMVYGWTGVFLDVMGLLSAPNDGIAHFAHLAGFLSIYGLIECIGVEHEDMAQHGWLLSGMTFFVSFGVSVLLLFV